MRGWGAAAAWRRVLLFGKLLWRRLDPVRVPNGGLDLNESRDQHLEVQEGCGLLRGTWSDAGFFPAIQERCLSFSNQVKVQDYKTFAFSFNLNYLSTDFGWAPVAGSILDPLPKW